MKCIVGTWQDAFNYVRSHREYLVNANVIIGKSHPRDFIRCLVDLYHWHRFVWTNNERFVDIFHAKDVIAVSGDYARPLSEHPDYGKHEMTSGEFWSVVGEDWVKTKLYSVGTWDGEKQAYTPQEGLSVPSQNVPWTGLLAVLRELRKMGYSCHRFRDPDGSHDTSVLVERTDGRPFDGQ